MLHNVFLEELMERIRSLVKTEARGSGRGAGASVLSRNEMNVTDQILFRLRQRLPNATPDGHLVPESYEFTALRVELEACINASEKFGEVNPRPPGFLNERIQSVKMLVRRFLSWYTRQLRLFHGAVIRTLQQCVATLEKQQEALNERVPWENLHAAEKRLDDVEQATYHIHKLSQSAIATSEAQYQATQDELKALRESLRELRAEIVSNRQNFKDAMTGYRLPEQSSSHCDGGQVKFLHAGSKKVERDQA
jgi:hypothetical protein